MTAQKTPVTSGLSGGLGNQMFQYAAARALSLHLQTPLQLDLSWFTKQIERRYALADFLVAGDTIVGAPWLPENLQHFESRLSRRWMPRRMGTKIHREPHYHFDQSFNAITEPVYLEGYWQSERYFAKFSNQIRGDFQLIQPLSDNRQSAVAKIAGTNAISVHVRRGDYVSNPVAQAHHGTCSPSWYELAMSKIASEVSNPTFFVFSDDPDWAQMNLPTKWPIQIVAPQKDNRDFEDIHLMSICRHHVIANSSFSWWGAWLNSNPDKRVIAPANWFANSINDTRDLLPVAWAKI